MMPTLAVRPSMRPCRLAAEFDSVITLFSSPGRASPPSVYIVTDTSGKDLKDLKDLKDSKDARTGHFVLLSLLSLVSLMSFPASSREARAPRAAARPRPTAAGR